MVGFRGELESSSADGEISLEGEFEKLSARSEDGAIVLTIPESANVGIRSNKNDIRAEGLPFVFVSATGNGSFYRIGKGGEDFILNSVAGDVLIRSTNSLRTTF